MRQTDSAMRMLISAYKAVLANCYIKETLAGGVKRFCKGVALSSFLTAVLAGVSTSSFATDLNPITDSFNNDYTDSVEINAGDVSAIELKEDGNKTVEIKTSNSDDGSITLNSEKYGIRDDSAGNNITINAAQNNVIKVTGEASDDSGDGINLTANATGSVSLTAKGNNDINTTDDGIYVDAGSKSKVSLTASENGNNKIVSGNNAIDFRGSESVSLTAVNGNNFLETTKGDGLRNTGSGEITVTGLSNDITTGDNGIQVGDSDNSSSGKVTVTANNGYNKITAGANGIEVTDTAENIEIDVSANGYNVIQGDVDGVKLGGSGTVTVSALANNTDTNIALLSNEDEDVHYNNYFIGEWNGIHRVDGSEVIFNATADNNNYISGGNNGILAEGVADTGETPSISITANSGSNIIGFETIDNDGESVGQIGKNGIKVTSGSVSLVAGDSNIIKASEKGVTVSGSDSYVSIKGNTNTITVEHGISDNNDYIYGIKSSESGRVDILGALDVNVVSTQGGARGIYAGKGGVVSVKEGDDFSLSVEHLNAQGQGNPQAQDRRVFGVAVNTETMGNEKGDNSKSQVNIAVDGNITFKVTSASENNAVAGVYADYDGSASLTSNSGSISFNISADNSDSGFTTSGIYGDKNSSINISAATGITIDSVNKTEGVSSGTVYGISVKRTSAATEKDNAGIVIAKTQGDINISAQATASASASTVASVSYSGAESGGEISLSGNNVILQAQGGKNLKSLSSSNSGKNTVNSKGDTSLTTILVEGSSGGNAYGIDSFNGDNTISALGSVIVNVLDYGTKNTAYGLHTFANGSNDSQTDIEGSSVSFSVNSGTDGKSYGIYSENIGSTAKDTIVDIESNGAVAGENNIEISAQDYGIYAKNSAQSTEAMNITLTSAGANVVTVSGGGVDVSTGVYSSNALINLTADSYNYVSTNSINVNDYYFGLGYAVNAEKGGVVSLNANNQNSLHGAVYANGTGTDVFIGNKNKDNSAAKLNEVYSNAYIDGAGGLSDQKIISALYAEEGAEISLVGDNNILRTYAVSSSDDLERVVWAYNGYADDYIGERVGSEITIKGNVQIKTDSYDDSFIGDSKNSKDVSIAAGTGTDLTSQKVLASTGMDSTERAQVNITYSNVSDKKDPSFDVEGDILSAYEGLVNINAADDNAGIKIKGNLLAGNNGILNVDLGKDGILTGRADDYGDAGVNGTEDQGHAQGNTFFNPAFSSDIFKGGAVNLTMGEGSQWNVTGQSWITSISTGITGSSADDVSALPMIDLTHADNENNQNAAGLTVYNFSGDSKFRMNLDGNELNKSNMLYMKKANGTYYIELEDTVSRDEINTEVHNGLRFATVGKDSNVEFHVGSIDNGVFNIEYEVDQDNYDETVAENERYNGSKLTAEKPGDSTVKEFFGNEGTPVEEVSGEAKAVAANAVMLMAEVSEEATDTAQQDNLTGAVNHKIVDIKSATTSDIGKTVIDMSRANYANAVYMDTLNKRQGEARFVGDTDHGVWVRLRHDNIGKDDSFRTHNTMVEVGFEQRDVNDYGEFHTGFALDYMNGQIDYHTVDGDGDIERYGLWFYTTYLGNDGQYADLILKYGHLKNDFGFNTKTQGEHVTGDYTNEVASISAEYGWKFSNSYNYYIEPQAQLQYSYVTGADYTTSQGSKVELDSIHSLIGRIGFRAGKDFNTETPITAYIRGDVLHEFLGDQDIYAYDNTGVMDVTYKNDDTWYSAGVGLSVQSSENTYFFIEGEQVFGADNDSTYTVSGGFKHSF